MASIIYWNLRTQSYIKTSNNDVWRTGGKLGSKLALSANGDTLAVGAVGDDSAASGVNPLPGNDCEASSTINCLKSAGAV